MSFYGDFAADYEAVFPFREPVFDFLRDRAGGGGGSVLDIGCGPGHYCGRFAATGFRALGVDLDPQMIAAAGGAHPEAGFSVLGMNDVAALAGDSPFDLVFCIGNVAAHLPRAELAPFLAALSGLIRPGGKWILQVVNWDRILAAGRADFPDRELPGGAVFRREYRELTPDRVVFATSLESDGETVFSGETDLFPVRAHQYVDAHAAAGFELLECLGDYAGAPFAPDTSPAAIFVFETAD